MSEKDLSVNQRIKNLIEQHAKLSQRAFAERIGVSQSAVSALFSQRENRPGLDMLQKIAVAYPEISLDWLLLGQGNMTKPTISSESADLERLANNVLSEEYDYEARTGIKLRSQVTIPDEHELAALLQREDELRRHLAYFRSVETGRMSELLPWEEPTPERLRVIAAQKIETQAQLSAVMFSRMRIERAMQRQSVANNIYRVDGNPDPSKTYGGLLAHRLDISSETALSLVQQGTIRSVYIDGEGYRVTEQAVREFLGEA